MKTYERNGKTVRWFGQTTPYSVQIEALSHSQGQRGWGHFLEQGLGKTQVALNEFHGLLHDGHCSKMLVNAPNSFKDEWRIEAEAISKDIPVCVYESGKTDLAKFFRANPHSWIIVMNPEAIITAKFAAASKQLSGEDVFYVWDESIKLKNNRGQITATALKHSAKCGWTRALSGKITTQGPHDLWGQLRFIKRCLEVNYYQFRGRYCVMGGFSGWQVIGTRNEEELQRNLRSCCFVARKKDWWADSPEKVYMPPRRVDMLPEQKKVYERMLKDFFVELAEEKLSIRQLVTRDQKLHQIKSGFVYDEAGKPNEVVPVDKNPRIKFALEYADEIEGKLVVVALYDYSLDALVDAFTKAGFKPVCIRGGMKPDEITEVKRRFNTEDDCGPIIVQQVATKYGHTLLGTEKVPCHSLLFYEQTYSLDDRSQIEDRIHRYGQRHDCTYQDISMSPLDNNILRALSRKEDIAAIVMQYGRETGLLPHALKQKERV